MTEIYAGIIFYNDGIDMLRRTFKSVRAAGCKIVAVDGAYKEFPRAEDQKPWSTDGCLEYAKEHADILIEAPACWESEVHKRNQYLKHIPDGEYCLYIDADEELEGGEIDLDLLEHDRYSVNFYEESENDTITTGGKHFRVFRVFDDLEYRLKHYWLYRRRQIQDPEDIDSGYWPRAEEPHFIRTKEGKDLLLKHFPIKRGLKRLDQDGQYKRTKGELKVRGEPKNPDIRNSVRLGFRIYTKTEWKFLCKNHDMTDREKFYNETITVEYVGQDFYSDAYVFRALNGRQFECPRWHYLQLIQDYGTLSFKEVNDVRSCIPTGIS